ncbi:MAG TPA: hypothetical protein PK358_04220 [Spirochaetota bacterium]|nr:hypothetical protein [Spirochaetota bacterium]
MDVYNPIFRITWPGPGAMGISIVLGLFFMSVVVYLLLLFLKMKERERLHAYQLFLFQVKRRGLNDFQIKIINNMAAQMKKADPRSIVTNAELFESVLSNFMEYLKRSREDIDDRRVICRDLLTIYEKLYIKSPRREPLRSMNEVENGQILYVTSQSGNTYLGKVSGRREDSLAIQLFTSLKNLQELKPEQQLEIFIVRVKDGEYRINTLSAGLEENRLLVSFSEDFVKEKEYRHPYISVVLPAVIVQAKRSEGEDIVEYDVEFEGTIYRINEFECELRTETEMPFEGIYTLMFELSDYSFRVASNVISSRTVEREKVYYVSLRFRDMSRPAMAVLSNFVMEHL